MSDNERWMHFDITKMRDFPQDDQLADEEFILYRYSRHLGGKHDGKNYMKNVDTLLQTAGNLTVNDPDTIEIRGTDLMDRMVFHWTAKEGMVHPKGINNPVFKARLE